VLVAGDVACYLTRQALRDIAAAWAANKAQDNGLVDAVLDEALITGSFDQLTGSSGSDWFIVSKDDKLTDFKGLNNKEGDVVTTVV
jgi:hypothetical protein